MSALELTLIVVALICLVYAAWQTRRAEQFVSALLRRESENRDARTELVQAFLDEQHRQETRHEGERLQWRDERAELLNAVLSAANKPAAMATAWPEEPPQKLWRDESDEVLEARARVAERIQAELEARPVLMPDEGFAA